MTDHENSQQAADLPPLFKGRGSFPNSKGPLQEDDPVLNWRLKPNSSVETLILGRRVTMEVDATGCRPVLGQPAVGEKTLAAYGCSCTYGVAIEARETFCSILQGKFPTWRIENHGVSGYSTSRNLIQLERTTRWSHPEIVTFCWIPHHLERNVASLGWIQNLSATARYKKDPVKRPFPRAGLDASGRLRMSSVQVPRPDIVELDVADFVPDPYYLDLVCFRLFERANEIVQGYNGHFFITTLAGTMSAALTDLLTAAGIAVLNASVYTKEYSCLPVDRHPNARANALYAERIHDYLLNRLADPL